MNDLSKWREDFRKGAREQANNGNPYWPDWDAVEKHIETLLARVIGEIEGLCATPSMCTQHAMHRRAATIRKTLGIQEP